MTPVFQNFVETHIIDRYQNCNRRNHMIQVLSLPVIFKSLAYVYIANMSKATPALLKDKILGFNLTEVGINSDSINTRKNRVHVETFIVQIGTW